MNTFIIEHDQFWEPGIPTSSSIQPESLRERSKRAKRARIVAAARKLFERKGFEATTAREICRHAGIGTGTLFLYARDKRELLFLVFRDEARALYRSGLEKAENASSLIDALMYLFGEFIEFYSRRPALSRWILEELFWREHEP
ncbi:MAG: TetR/AcrR family transcriptional regulator, partial [Myxococcota bacterium]